METAHLPNGTLLQGGKYRIVRFIGSGGFGCTYEGEHTMLGSKVAIKEFFVKDFCNREETTSHVTVGTTEKKGLVEKLLKKFVEEARFTAGLRHPNIARVSDVFEENDTAYYVMDYMEGQSLDKLVKENGPLKEETALEYIRQIADALAYVHSLNRLHLDVKPGNIMTDERGNAVLIDFGASKQYDEVGGENTSTLMGKTPGYAPIEQMGNTVTTFTPATDIYALGATLYKLLTGTTPLEATMLASGEELAPLPSNISASTVKAVSASMRAWRRDRPQSVAEFLALLEEPAEEPNMGVETPANPTPPAPVIPDPAERETIIDSSLREPESQKPTYSPQPKPTIEPQPNPEQPQKPKSKKGWMIAGIVLGVVAVVAGTIAFIVTYTPRISSVSVMGQNNGQGYVDLGLSVNWATCNVGASSPSDYGNYYAWGETTTKSDYTESNSATYNKQMGSIAGNSQYDAATANWGGTWRMPTYEEIGELIDKCTWEWVQLEGQNGYEVTGPNGNSIFLPAAGWRKGLSLYRVGKSGLYWSAMPGGYDAYAAYDLDFSESGITKIHYYRFIGLSVRPVLDQTKSTSSQTSTQTSTSTSSTPSKTTNQTPATPAAPATTATPAALDASSLLSGSGKDTDNKHGSARKKRE